MARGHAHGDSDFVVEPTTRRNLWIIAGVLFALTAIGVAVLRPTGDNRPDLRRLGVASDLYDANVIAEEEGPCTGTRPEDAVLCEFLTLELEEGPDAGETTVLELTIGAASPEVGVGDEIIVTRGEGPQGEVAYQFADRQRRGVLIALAILFAVAVVVLGRVRGLAALGGLIVSVVVLLQFALPAIIDGRPPVFVAIVASALIAFFALYLAHGFKPMTTVALLGTLASLALTALLAALFVWLGNFSGFASEEAFFLEAAGGQIDLEGILLAGIVIGALGALDDMTVTQASAVWELRAANPAMPFAELYGAGLRIGRDHVASTVNTLLLAYAGAAMPLLLLFVLSNQSLGAVANSEIVAEEIVRTLVGSIGLVSAVPFTTWLAARVAPSSKV